MRSASSPGASGGETGVYGRTMGLPLASSNASLDAFTRRNDATGISDASLFGNSKTKLKQDFSKRNRIVRKRI